MSPRAATLSSGTMTTRKLGRGLDVLVALPPAADDGTARVAETIRAASDVSVLALSGRSVEDFFRAIPRADIVANVPVGGAAETPRRAAAATAAPAPQAVPQAVPPAADIAPPWRPAPSPSPRETPPAPQPLETPNAPMHLDLPPDDDAREIQHTLFDPPIEEPQSYVAEDPAPDVFVSEAVGEPVAPPAAEAPEAPEAQAAPAAPALSMPESPALPRQAPANADTPNAADDVAAAPSAVEADDSAVFLDDEVGGSFLPDVELE